MLVLTVDPQYIKQKQINGGKNISIMMKRICPLCNSPADSDDSFIYCKLCGRLLAPSKKYDVLSERVTSEWTLNASNDSLIKIMAGEFQQGYNYDSRTEYFDLTTQYGIKVYTNEDNDDRELRICAIYWKDENFDTAFLEDIADWLNSALDAEFDSAKDFVKAFDSFISNFTIEWDHIE